MGCSNCSSTGGCSSTGCGDNGNCNSGGCNKLNTFDWLANMEMPDMAQLDVVELSFKDNMRKAFYRLPPYLQIHTGDLVAVESKSGGYDIGRVSLMGELVRLQMKKKRVKPNAILPNVLRTANERDLERLAEARAAEQETMVRARVLARELQLDMKIGAVEYQGDRRKATFYYTADGRVDFRELIRIFAREFRVKIEMRQIGARQESALIGGLGPCGRELCCSTWLTDFKSVSTTAARYQNLAINQSKLSGQCGRLKCCLNFELNTYLDALKTFPKHIHRLETEKGSAQLLKTDIFKRIMYFAYQKEFGGMEVFPLSVERVQEIAAQNKKGQKPYHLSEFIVDNKTSHHFNKETGPDDFVDGSGSLELSELKEDRKRNNRKRKRKRKPKNPTNQGPKGPQPTENKTKPSRSKSNRKKRPRNSQNNKAKHDANKK
ncbi:PSP1 domain-containing protein [Saprospira grandis]|uniref:PSP1 domain-containing protein n=1 Tax=Saprospira grandis TaxID=1008 RepID=UPI0022DDF452|nr:regulatory iron-sulfur-containing complex subunit RicT [Saprospira grandis]WBM73104.1 regulatory iron-sulfur-containing complex subunit RicT [Saprospira grandis]